MNISLHWKSIGLKIKRRKRGTRGGRPRNARDDLNVSKTTTVRNSYNIPRIMYTNACSLNNDKLESLLVLSLEYDVIAVTETWSGENHLLNINNFIAYETQRRDKTGGGTVIFVRESIQCTRFNNYVNNNSNEFEITWVIVRPTYLPRNISVVAIACIYIPPNSNRGIQTNLYKSLNHAQENIRRKYSNPGFIILGDFNRWKYANSFSSCSNFKQMIKFPTFIDNSRNTAATLDLAFSNISNEYNTPKSLPPLKDGNLYHVCFQILPKSKVTLNINSKQVIKYRDYTKDNLYDFATLIENTNWQPFYNNISVDFKWEYLNSLLINAFEVTFPLKEKVMYKNDRLWITPPLTKLFKKLKKVTRGSMVHSQIQNEIKKQIKVAKCNYNLRLQKGISDDPNKIHSVVTKLCNTKQRISAAEQISVSENISLLSTLNMINSHFSAINNRYEPIKDMPKSEALSLNSLYVNEQTVLKCFEKLNLVKSNVPGALPTRFLKFAAVHIVPLITHIFNFSFKNYCVPNEWKKGFITPVPKDLNNVCIENLRPITQTDILCKMMEGFMFKRIYDQIKGKLSFGQFGGIKKSSTTHYLVSLFDFILKALDKPNTYVIIVLLDLSKAFDLVDHNILIKILIEMEVDPNDIHWVAEFLKNRTQCSKHNNKLSEFLPISNGTPQGTKIAILLFILLVNDLLSMFHDKYKDENNLMNAFVDDMCFAEAISYKSAPKINSIVSDICKRMSENKMCVNAKKSNVIIIDNSRDKKFSNTKIVIDGTEIPKCNVAKLLGVMINDKCEWSAHVNHIYNKSIKKLHIIRKLKYYGFKRDQLKTMYVLHVRSILEYACVLWSNNLTKQQIKMLKSVEKRALSIILGKYVSKNNYLNNCDALGIDCLEIRWTHVLENFGKKLLKNELFKNWIECHRNRHYASTRYNKRNFNFRIVACKYERYRRSTIPTLIRLLRSKCN